MKYSSQLILPNTSSPDFCTDPGSTAWLPTQTRAGRDDATCIAYYSDELPGQLGWWTPLSNASGMPGKFAAVFTWLAGRLFRN